MTEHDSERVLNTKRGPARNLYCKVVFCKTVAGTLSPYERCNIQD